MQYIETNYVSELLETRKMELAIIPSFQQMVVDSQKFRLPPNGLLLDVINFKQKREGDDSVVLDLEWFQDNYLPIFKLPYPFVALEYLQHHEKGINVKTVLIVTSNPEGTQWRINYFYIITEHGRPRTNGWQPFFYTLVFDVNELEYSFIDSPLAAQKPIDPSIQEHYTNELVIALYVLLSFLAALNCSNIQQKEQIAPIKLNKKRSANSKVPFFDYKVLTINTKEASPTKNGITGTHASPRQHLRRGHIRRLKNKHVWVNSCVVGDATKGMVKKDYNII